MASLESLPADQRAVLQMVLQRGRTYDQIADMLSIDRAGVRQRALEALDALGPHTRVPPERRALITDYLLGQLPERVAADTRERLAESPAERAWARVIASELASLTSGPLPEIPVESSSQRASEPPVTERTAAASFEAEEPAAEESAKRPTKVRPIRAPGSDGPRSSRRGGAILLGLLAAVIVAVVVVLLVSGGGGKKKNNAAAAGSGTTTSTSASRTASPQVVGQINLTSPTSGSKTAGIAEVLKSGNNRGILIAAQNVPPNTKHDAYAVWLFNTPGDSRILGFVSPGVGSNGRLSTAGALPPNASHYKQLLVTRETGSKPRQPGTIVLQGALSGIS
jgi:Sigma-70, region 4